MAQRTVVELIDDLDGSTASETVTFGLDGVAYEIDLSEEHAGELHNALRAYVEAARRMDGGKTGGMRRGRRKAASADGRAPKGSNAEIRAWAESQGIEVSKRGRIPAHVVARFEEAQAS